jgi:hypothetical protein
LSSEPGRREIAEDGVKRGFETHVKRAVGFVDHETLERDALEVRSLVHVLQKPSRSAHKHVDASDTVLLCRDLLATDEHSTGIRVVLANNADVGEDLESEFAGGSEHKHAEAIERGPLLAEEALECWYKEGERLAAAGFSGAEDVAAAQRVGDARTLHCSELLEAGGAEGGGGGG